MKDSKSTAIGITTRYYHCLVRLPALLALFCISTLCFGQTTATENFELESNLGTTFSQGGINFTSTGKMRVYYGLNSKYGANSSDGWLESDHVEGNRGQNVGGFQIATPATTFKINSFAAWTSNVTGISTAASGVVTFVGTKSDNSTVSVTRTINPTANDGTGWHLNINFTGTALQDVQLVKLEFILPANLLYFSIDDVNFTTAPVVANQYSINDAAVAEGNSGTKLLTFTVTRTQTTQTGSVTVATANNTALSGSDYVALSPTVVSFAVGESSKNVSVTINGDATPEPDETFFVNLSAPVNGDLLKAQGIATIKDDDSVTETFEGETVNGQNFSESGFNFSSTDKLMISSGSGVGFSASLDTRIGNGGSTGSVGSFHITTAATSFNIVAIDVFTSANDGGTAASGNVTFLGTIAGGETVVGHTAPVTPSGDNFTTVSFAGTSLAGRQLTSIEVVLEDGLNYVALDNFRFGTGEIIVQQVSINDVSVIEGTGAGNTNMNFTVTRTSNATAVSVDVNLSHVTTDNADFLSQFLPVTVQFPVGGALTQNVTIPVNRDNVAEPNEVFHMLLSNVTNGATILDGLGIGTINDDDGIIETFEDEANDTAVFSQNSIGFNTSGHLKVRNRTGFGSGASNFFLDTGIGDGATTGSAGALNITTANKGFKLVAVDAWTSASDGAGPASATLTFKGTLATGGTVQTNKNINPTGDIPGGWVKNIGFSGTPLQDAVLSALEVLIVSGADFVALDNFNFVTVNTDPEIEVTGISNQVVVSGGGNSPSAVNGTDFGSICPTDDWLVRTFTIKNLAGTGSLNLTGEAPVTLSGDGASHFTITAQPGASSVAPGGTTTFSVRFNPSVAGTHDAVVSIANNDLDEGNYTFDIRGVADPITMPLTFTTITQDVNETLFAGDCEYFALVIPSGPSPVSGEVKMSHWVEDASSFGFVPRHYEITPLEDENAATATITLYFTQADFDTYNSTLEDGFLPASPDDDSQIQFLQVVKYAGVSDPANGLPGSYLAGTPQIIIPESVEWNALSQLWEVTFEVDNGFSGFFISSSSQTLPIHLISFSARVTSENQVMLNWLTAEEKWFSNFEVERSVDAVKFERIGVVPANIHSQSDQKAYAFVDATAKGLNYYRLRMNDTDGTYSYSKIISVGRGVTEMVGNFYPNPSDDIAVIDIHVVKNGIWTVTVIDALGRVVYTGNRELTEGLNRVALDKLAFGLNVVHFEDGSQRVIRKVIKH